MPENNPPRVKIIFFKDGPNIKNINCYSNEQNKWRKTKLNFINEKELSIILDGKFTTERGRINCSLREKNWRMEMVRDPICYIKLIKLKNYFC